MHFLLYVCTPVCGAKTSLDARRAASEYLASQYLRRGKSFYDLCDYFSVGGRYSGMLKLLRLQSQEPKIFARFVRQYVKAESRADAVALFRRMGPRFRGGLPAWRYKVDDLGRDDDAQVLDTELFAVLRPGFSSLVRPSFAFEEPNVIFTDCRKTEWRDQKNVLGRQWVVVIDYHG